MDNILDVKYRIKSDYCNIINSNIHNIAYMANKINEELNESINIIVYDVKHNSMSVAIYYWDKLNDGDVINCITSYINRYIASYICNINENIIEVDKVSKSVKLLKERLLDMFYITGSNGLNLQCYYSDILKVLGITYE